MSSLYWVWLCFVSIMKMDTFRRMRLPQEVDNAMTADDLIRRARLIGSSERGSLTLVRPRAVGTPWILIRNSKCTYLHNENELRAHLARELM